MPVKKPKKQSNNEKAEARITALLKRGIVIHTYGNYGDYTVGPYRKAVGKPGYVIFGYKGFGARMSESHRHAEFDRAEDAASHLVAWIGSGRAREAAIAAEKKAARGQ